MKSAVIMGVVVVGLGCHGSTGDASPSASGSASAAAPVPVASAVLSAASAFAAPSPQAFTYTCDTAIPQAFRDKHAFGTMRMDQGGTKGEIHCHFVDLKMPTRQRGFDFRCGHPSTDESVAIKRKTFHEMAKDAIDFNVGRGGYAGTFMGVQQVYVYDDKSDCELTMGFGMEKPPSSDFTHPDAFASDALATLRAAAGK